MTLGVHHDKYVHRVGPKLLNNIANRLDLFPVFNRQKSNFSKSPQK